jgi:hypothetical protein
MPCLLHIICHVTIDGGSARGAHVLQVEVSGVGAVNMVVKGIYYISRSLNFSDWVRGVTSSSFSFIST